LHFAATPIPVFAIIALLDRAGPIDLATAYHRSSLICRTTGRACALVTERAWTRTMRCCDDDRPGRASHGACMVLNLTAPTGH
jgi:hypothetical protein